MQELSEWKNLFNEIKKFIEMQELKEGKNLFNEIQKFNEMQELKKGKNLFWWNSKIQWNTRIEQREKNL